MYWTQSTVGCLDASNIFAVAMVIWWYGRSYVRCEWRPIYHIALGEFTSNHHAMSRLYRDAQNTVVKCKEWCMAYSVHVDVPNMHNELHNWAHAKQQNSCEMERTAKTILADNPHGSLMCTDFCTQKMAVGHRLIPTTASSSRRYSAHLACERNEIQKQHR